MFDLLDMGVIAMEVVVVGMRCICAIAQKSTVSVVSV